MDESKKRNLTNPVLVVLLVVAAFAIGMLWQKNQTLSKGTPTGTTGEAAAPNPLSVENLKAYAADLKLDKNQFNKCLDESKYKDRITADLDQGGTLGVAGTPAFFVNGKFIGGAFPFEWFKEIIDKEIAGTGSEDVKTYSENLQKVADQGAFDPKKKVVEIKEDDPVKGNANAKVTLVEFSDFQCPYCLQAFPTVNQIMETYGDNVKLIYKQFPLTSIHPYAQKAAEAALCAKEQGKFYEYHDKLFGSQERG